MAVRMVMRMLRTFPQVELLLKVPIVLDGLRLVIYQHNGARLYFAQNSQISQIIFFSRGHFASVFEPTEFVASSATTAGAVFAKASDTSLWILRAKLRNSSSDSATVWGKSVSSVDFV